MHVIGREPELSALHDFLRQGHGSAGFLLVGRPGIGKTTLWEAALGAARQTELRVLSARPSGAEAQLAFAALADLLDGVDTGALAGLPAPQHHALEVALLRAEPGNAPPEPRAIALGFLSVLRALSARGRVVVALDDVQWLDPASEAALTFAARRLQGARVGFLIARRSGHASSLEQALEGRLLRAEVGPLTLGATRRLLLERLGLSLPRPLLRRIFDSAQGNPLFALELGRTLVEGRLPEVGAEIAVPDAIEELLGTRVEGLPAAVRRLLLTVALSAGLSVEQLVAIADRDLLDDAHERGLLVVDGGQRVRPAHPLVGSVAVMRSHVRERRELHLVLADVVAEDELRARHLALATEHPDAELAHTVAAAAAAAAGRGATESAVELANHALRLTPQRADERADRLLALAEYLLMAGEPKRATNLLSAEADALPSGPTRARAHLLLADSHFVASHVDEFGDHLELAVAESEADPALRALVMARKAQYSAVACVKRIPAAEAWALDALTAARGAGPDVEREVLHGLGWARTLRGRPIDDLRERFGAVSGDASHILRSLERVAGERHTWRGELTQARAIFTRLLALADERGEVWSYVTLRLQLCEVELRSGEWDTASRLLEEWDESLDRELLVVPAYERCRAFLALGYGRAGEAERWAARAIAGSEASGLRWDLLEALRARGIAALLAHDPGRAVESLRAVWEHTCREEVDEPGAFPVAPDLVEALAELGETVEAQAVTDRLGELAAEQQHPWGLATARRCHALVRLASHTYDDEIAAAFAQAGAAYEELGLRFDRGRSLLSLGRAERRLRKWGAARRSLQQAVVVFDGIGSAGWAEQARSELARVGARRPRPRGELTPTEARVAELAGAGLSNKEIAQALFVAVHTVEVHLSRAYRKLGVRSRSQLAGHIAGTTVR